MFNDLRELNTSTMKSIKRIAPDVGWLPISFVNVFFVGHPGGPWMLIDAGLPGRAEHIADAAEARFGGGARPEAILLTHGHFDHVGSALALAEKWDVPDLRAPKRISVSDRTFGISAARSYDRRRDGIFVSLYSFASARSEFASAGIA